MVLGPPISGNLHILVNHNHDSLTSAAFRDSYPILQPSLGIFSLTSISDAWSPGWRKPWLNSGHMWSPGVGKNHQLANKMEVSWGFHSHGATPIAGWFTKKNIYGWGLGVPPFQDRPTRFKYQKIQGTGFRPRNEQYPRGGWQNVLDLLVLGGKLFWGGCWV